VQRYIDPEFIREQQMEQSATELPATLSEEVAATEPPRTFHLREHILSPFETLAQSISTIAPSASPTLTVPAVFALAGEGTWLAYLLALTAMILVAFCIAVFARNSASPGSLYVYIRNTLPPSFAALAAWSLFFAYVATAASVTGGFINYAYVLMGHYGTHVSPILLGAISSAGAIWIAHRDVKLSTRAMLYIEGVSVFLISIVIGLVLWKHGFHMDLPQFRLHGVTASGIRLGTVLAIFSFVGFESATALGSEAREPLKTIPRAVIRSALLVGVFFLICAYGEVLGYRGSPSDFGQSTAPLRYLSAEVHISVVGRIIDLGVLVSMFACTLGCIIAASRVLMLMAHHGLVHKTFVKTHKVRQTPVAAGIITGLLVFIPIAFLGWKGTSPSDMYAYLGTLAVYGFLTIYALVSIAMPIHLSRRGHLTAGGVILAVAATAVLLLAMVGSLYPVPPAPIRYFPYLYLAYIAAGMLWYVLRRSSITAAVSS
jgi:amino acid transporter